jgi:acyl carrier protein
MITVEQIFDILLIVKDDIDTSKIDLDKPLKEYGIDSMDFFDIVLQLQEILGEEIPDEDITSLLSISGILKYFEEKSNNA